MNLIRPYGETAQNLSVAEDERERRDVARRLISQSADMCLMCACALDSAVIEGGGCLSARRRRACRRPSRLPSREPSATSALLRKRSVSRGCGMTREEEREALFKASGTLDEAKRTVTSVYLLLCEVISAECSESGEDLTLWGLTELLDLVERRVEEATALIDGVREARAGESA